MALDTLVDVDLAIADAIAMPMTKPAEIRIRAARLADLYEVQAQLFEAARDSAGGHVPGIYVTACGRAAHFARQQVQWWRSQAESRRVKRARR